MLPWNKTTTTTTLTTQQLSIMSVNVLRKKYAFLWQLFKYNCGDMSATALQASSLPTNNLRRWCQKFFHRWKVHNRCLVSGQAALVAAAIAASESLNSITGVWNDSWNILNAHVKLSSSSAVTNEPARTRVVPLLSILTKHPSFSEYRLVPCLVSYSRTAPL